MKEFFGSTYGGWELHEDDGSKCNVNAATDEPFTKTDARGEVVYQRLCAAMRAQQCEWMVHGALRTTSKTGSVHLHDVMNDGKCHECA